MSVVKSFSVGDGDMFYIKHNSSNFTIIDCNLLSDNINAIINEISSEYTDKKIVRFISTHPDEDHITGLKALFDKLSIPNFYCVNNNVDKNKEDVDFNEYRYRRDKENTFLLNKECERLWMNINDVEKNYGSAGIEILWPDVDNEKFKEALNLANNGGEDNNISPIIQYSIKNGITFLWFGDLESDFMESVKNIVSLPKCDIVFAPHHSRKTGKLPRDWLKAMEPRIIVVGEADSEYLEYYQGYNTITQNSAGDVTFVNNGSDIDIYVSKHDYSVDFLKNYNKPDKNGDKYLGTLSI